MYLRNEPLHELLRFQSVRRQKFQVRRRMTLATMETKEIHHLRQQKTGMQSMLPVLLHLLPHNERLRQPLLRRKSRIDYKEQRN